MVPSFDETLTNHEEREGHEGFGFFVIVNFVVFVSFVVKFVSFLVAVQQR